MTQEVKVGSLWNEKDGAIIEVLSVKGRTAFVAFKNKPDGALVHMEFFDRCTPYTPQRRCEGWVHVYDLRGRLCFGGSVYPSKACALAARDTGRAFSTVKIEYEEPQS